MPQYIYQDGLEAERLTTRFLVREDIPAWTDFFKDKEAVEFFSNPDQLTEEQRATQWIEKQLTRYKEKRYGMQMLIDKQTKTFIGQCGLLKQEVDGISELEVGYHIFKKYWGKGYAPEAARLFINYAFQNNLSPSVISIIHTQNIKSQRVAEKNGLAIEKKTQWMGMEVFVYRISRLR